ncbi:MAG: helix-turn-helix domain-containing protein [Chthoniobacterales bacterium]
MNLLFHGIGHYAAQKQFGADGWPHHDLLIVKQGRIHFQTKLGSFMANTDDALLIPPKCYFQGESMETHSAIWVTHFKKQRNRLVDSLLQEKYIKSGIYFFEGGIRSGLASSIMQRIDENYLGDSTWRPFTEEYFSTLLCELLANICLLHDDKKHWVQNLQNWAKKNLHQSIGIRELAAHAKLSESHFRKLFRKRSGTSAGHFLLKLRMEEAKKLLLETDFNIKEISSQIGYSDPVSFHHAFAHYTQTSPNEYRAGKPQII